MFAFSQIEPRTRGYVAEPEVPLSRFLGAAFEQGQNDSMSGAIYRISEQFQVDKDINLFGLLDQQTGRTLTPDEANDQYGTRQLRFTEPVREGVAQIMHDRHIDQERRTAILSAGASSASRLAGAFGVSMLGSLLTPVDFATMFVPVVGSEKAAAQLGLMGASPIRSTFARGLITEEALSSVPAKALVSAVIDGTAGQAIAEIPQYVSNRMDNTPYDIFDSVQNIALGGAFAGTLRLGIEGAGKLIGLLAKETKTAVVERAMNQVLAGEDIKVDDLMYVDRNLVKKTVFDEVAARDKAWQQVNEQQPEIAAQMRQRLDDIGEGDATLRDLIDTENERRVRKLVDEARAKISPENETRKKTDSQLEEVKKAGTMRTEEEINKKIAPTNDLTDKDVADLQAELTELQKSFDPEDIKSIEVPEPVKLDEKAINAVRDCIIT